MKAICIITFVLGALTSVIAERSAPVEFVLSTPHSIYAIGEPIPISLFIRTHDSSRLLEYRQSLARRSSGNFTVIDPKGKGLARLSESEVRASFDNEWEWIAISNHASLVRVVDLTEVYSEPYYIETPHSMTATGVYQVSYGAEIEVRPVSIPDDIWAGIATSATLNITIKDVNSNMLTTALQAVSDIGQDRALKMRSLTMLQYAAAPLTTGEYDLLRRSYGSLDQELKRKVLRVFGAKRSASGFTAVSDILVVEKDPLLRSEAIVALGQYNSPAARKLIMEECKARKERSYRAAIVVLGAIGDEGCMDVLREIANTDELDWVRQRALKSIKEIERRKGSDR